MAELDDLVMHRALTPLQLAVFIVESFPSRPDGFAVVEAVTCMPGASQSLRRSKVSAVPCPQCICMRTVQGVGASLTGTL